MAVAVALPSQFRFRRVCRRRHRYLGTVRLLVYLGRDRHETGPVESACKYLGAYLTVTDAPGTWVRWWWSPRTAQPSQVGAEKTS